MRIITGTLKGRKIDIPDTLNVRPTSDRTKEGMFSIIESRTYLKDARILDLFAGSGNLGFEAISRGAAQILAIDSDPDNVRHILRTGAELGIESKITALASSTEDFLSKPGGSFDLIFSDPPYDYPLMHDMVRIILTEEWLQEGGWLILEHDKRHDFSEHEHCLLTRPYGRTIVSIFTPHPQQENS